MLTSMVIPFRMDRLLLLLEDDELPSTGTAPTREDDQYGMSSPLHHLQST